MDTISIERYSPAHRAEWDDFVARSRNGTFLLQRGYMDYHSDRFRDCSWMAYQNGKLRAILPANIDDAGTLHSHQGLTYGGWITPVGHLDGEDLLKIFGRALEVWSKEGIRELDYKRIPYIYCRTSADEDLYALFRLGAVQTGCGLSSAINLREGVGFNQMQRRHLRKSQALPLTISEETNVAPFMGLLTDCLQERHGVNPVHTCGEMQMLRDRFPQNIRVFVLKLDGEAAPQAGVCMYDTGTVAHAQYIATTPQAREQNLLTPLFHHLISEVFADRRYFDFGISTEDNGNYLNTGLLRQKFSYGGTGVTYDRYSLKF